MAADEEEMTTVELAPVAAADRSRDVAGNRWLGGLLLVIVVVLAALLATAYARTDVDAIADPGWQDDALWAAGAAVVLLGVAFLVLAWSIASPSSDGVLARSAVGVAVIGVIVGIVVLGLADVNGGEVARSSVAPYAVGTTPATTSTGAPIGEDPIPLSEAMDIENLTSAAFPVEVRTIVELELTTVGREMIAAAQGCRPRDLSDNLIRGAIVGGTWVQPLVIVSPPITEDGRVLGRCHRIATRLTPEAGFAVPSV